MKKRDKRIQRKYLLDDPKSTVSEAFRTLRTNIQFTAIDKEVKSIVITSTRPREGKSTISFNLAITMAMAGQRTLLIDGDLRKPHIHNYIKSNNDIGLTNILADDADFMRVINLMEDYDNMHVITSGPVPPNPAELLSSQKIKKFLKNISNYYDSIIFDAPPIGAVTDGAILSTIVDGAILVAEANFIKKEELLRSKESLDRVGANILGVILNGVIMDKKSYQYQYYND